MRSLRFVFVVLALFTIVVPTVNAQAPVASPLPPEPVCQFGYYGAAPYECAPYGYYNPDWFVQGVFIGAGPWYRGRADGVVQAPPIRVYYPNDYSYGYYGYGSYNRPYYGGSAVVVVRPWIYPRVVIGIGFGRHHR